MTMKRFLVASAALLLLSMQSSTALAQAGSDLRWLMGLWTGSGTSMGKPSESTFEVQPILNNQFVEFRYRLTQPAPFEGRAIYQEWEDGVWQAQWFDSRGVIFPIDAYAEKEKKMLTSRWGTPQSEQGRTVYQLLDDGRLEIVDSVLGKDGQWGVFARQTFSKAPQ